MNKKTQELLAKIIPEILALCYCHENMYPTATDHFKYGWDKNSFLKILKKRISTRGYELDQRIDSLRKILLDMGILDPKNDHMISRDNLQSNMVKYAAPTAPVYTTFRSVHADYNNEGPLFLYVVTHPDEYLVRKVYNDSIEVCSKDNVRAHTIETLRGMLDCELRDHWQTALREIGREDVIEEMRRHFVKKFLETLPLHINEAYALPSYQQPENSPKFLMAHADLIEYDILYSKEVSDANSKEAEADHQSA